MTREGVGGTPGGKRREEGEGEFIGIGQFMREGWCGSGGQEEDVERWRCSGSDLGAISGRQ